MLRKSPTKNAKLLIVALESGEFKQTNGVLRSKRSDNRQAGYCCLGVACELFRRETGVGKWVTPPNETTWTFVVEPDDEANTFLPEAVRKWLGFSTQDGNFIEPGDGNNTLAALNDSGVPFDEIAKIIRKAPEGLFE